MLKMVIMVAVLIIQLLPNLIVDLLPPDMQWHMYITALLSTTVLLALLFYVSVEFGKTYCSKILKLGALVVMLVAIYDIVDYTAITYFEGYEPRSYKVGLEGG